MNISPLVSVITVNYNGISHTLEMIKSLYKYIDIPFEIIVVDNGSTENEAKLIQQEFPDIKVIRSDQNKGFAGGNNLGIRIAQGEYLFFLNNDTYIINNGIINLVNTLKYNQHIGGVSPMIRFASPPQNIQFAGYTRFSYITLRNHLIGYGEQPSSFFMNMKETSYLHGAAMMVKREVIDCVGEMPEEYFLYYEELDWCEQIRKRGYLLHYDPRWVVFHKESQTTGQFSPLRSFYLTRNRLLFAWRNCKRYERYFSLLYQTLLVIPKDITFSLIKKKPYIANAIIKGAKSFYTLKGYK